MSTLKVTVDAYAVLAVARDASTSEINAAYKRLALKFHPDHAGNTEAANEKFREINEAVEVLRDPQSRNRLDAQLNVNNKRARASDEFPSYGFNRPGRSARRTKRDRRPAPQFYTTQQQGQCPPESPESKARRERAKAENERYERECAAFEEEVEKARAELRKERMQARHENFRAYLTRDLIDQLVDGPDPEFEEIVSRVVNDGMDEIEANKGRRRETPKPEEAPPTCNPAATFDAFAYEYAKAASATGNSSCSADGFSQSYDFTAHSRSPSANSPCSADGFSQSYDFTAHTRSPSASSSSSSAGYYSAGGHTHAHPSSGSHVSSEHYRFSTPHSSPRRKSPGSASSSTSSSSSAGSNVPPAFPATDPFDNGAEFFRAACENIKPVDSDLAAVLQTASASLKVDPASMRVLVPYFNKKLADPQGRYTLLDYQAEINGIMLEMYCIWLEESRLSVPGALPIPAVRVSQSTCRHLGVWEKGFCRPKCEACAAWMPLFTLTCKSCKFKACLRCKYQVNLRSRGLSTGFRPFSFS
ncbi:Heat shock protein DnaJ N-terminal [Penicillium sp. DV-2018c]|nr:Heat shock protein DnaJ N-terminal [Penicillium sp. DV-2018c]